MDLRTVGFLKIGPWCGREGWGMGGGEKGKDAYKIFCDNQDTLGMKTSRTVDDLFHKSVKDATYRISATSRAAPWFSFVCLDQLLQGSIQSTKLTPVRRLGFARCLLQRWNMRALQCRCCRFMRQWEATGQHWPINSPIRQFSRWTSVTLHSAYCVSTSHQSRRHWTG